MSPEPRIPTPEGLNAEFYARAAGGTLHLQRCSDCGRHRHPPRYRCGRCGSGAYDWAPSPGHGRLFSWTVTHFPFDRGWADDLPYVTAAVELDEGVRLIGALGGVAREALRIGLPLQARLEPRGEAFTFLTFLPTTAAS